MPDLIPFHSASGVPPEMEAQLIEMQRRKQVANALTAQSMEPIKTQEVSGRVVPNTFGEGLTQIGKALIAAQTNRSLGKQNMDLVQQYRTGLQGASNAYEQQRAGTLKGTMPDPQEFKQSADQGTPSPEVFAQKPDPRGAIKNALMSGYGPVMDMAKADRAQLEKGTLTQRDILDLKGDIDPKSRMVAAQILAEGGTPAMAMRALTASGPTPDTVLKEQGAQRRFEGVSGNVAAEQAGAQARHEAPSGSAMLSDARVRELNGLVAAGQEATLNPIIEANAQLVAKGKAAISGFGANSLIGRRIMARAAEINPNFDATTYPMRLKAREAFASGTAGDTVRSLNVANDHFDTFIQYADALKNKDVVQANRLRQTLSEQFGHAEPTNVDAVRQVLEKEAVKALVRQGGGVGEREEIGKTFARARSMEQLRGAAEAYSKLFAGQLSGLKRQYEFGTKMTDFDEMLSPKSRGQLATMSPQPVVPSTGSSLQEQADAILRDTK